MRRGRGGTPLTETADRLLRYLAEKAAEGDGRRCVASRRSMVRDLGLSITMISYASSALEDGGLLVIERRYGEDGGQLANGYTITDTGALYLERAERE